MFTCVIEDSPEFNRKLIKTYKPRKRLNIWILRQLSPLFFPIK